MKQKPLEELTQRISAFLPDSLRNAQADFETNIHGLLQETFSKLNIVTREEFDIQSALLQRTREKLDNLEKQLDEIQSKS